jgi:hypothetical protein
MNQRAKTQQGRNGVMRCGSNPPHGVKLRAAIARDARVIYYW